MNSVSLLVEAVDYIASKPLSIIPLLSSTNDTMKESYSCLNISNVVLIYMLKTQAVSTFCKIELKVEFEIASINWFFHCHDIKDVTDFFFFFKLVM